MKKLNFGCGTNLLIGWENYDICPMHGANYFNLVEFPYDFCDYSIDFIEAEHVLEHLSLREFYGFLLESRRILKDGGVMRIAVPSVVKIFESSNDEYLKFIESQGWGEKTKEGAIRNILLNHGHKLFFSIETLSCLLQSLGFKTKECKIGESEDANLRNIEGHYKVLGWEFAELETIVIEATK